ncbi:hypothetical protein RchiOBHm_Chr2g0145071 [Rosa chinensis]|uniref:Transmembrane protein n=1 Tax=Rosa chinensis TaxID=74649 RepID=A0A2P6RYJ9_ROSCH|nr:hypothetical protein RchiOBHm_Chr2g0145071 [Rosa chinensis]
MVAKLKRLASGCLAFSTKGVSLSSSWLYLGVAGLARWRLLCVGCGLVLLVAGVAWDRVVGWMKATRAGIGVCVSKHGGGALWHGRDRSIVMKDIGTSGDPNSSSAAGGCRVGFGFREWCLQEGAINGGGSADDVLWRVVHGGGGGLNAFSSRVAVGVLVGPGIGLLGFCLGPEQLRARKENRDLVVSIGLTDKIWDNTSIAISSSGMVEVCFSIWPGYRCIIFYGNIRKVLVVSSLKWRVPKHKQRHLIMIVFYTSTTGVLIRMIMMMTVEKEANWVE